MKKLLFLVVISFFIEAVAVYFFLIEKIFFYFILHILASSLYLLVPKLKEGKFRDKTGLNLLILSFLGGPLGVLLASVSLIYLLSETIPIYKDLFPSLWELLKFQGRKLGEAALNVKTSYNTVLYASKILHPNTIRHLKKAIILNDDEIRLLAFNKLANIEKLLMPQIEEVKEILDKARTKNEKLLAYSYLAELYWELAYLQISDKELEQIYLQEAEIWALKAIHIKVIPRMVYLLGKIYLKINRLDLAEIYFRRALELNFPKELVIPYLLEIAFRKKDWLKLYEIIEEASNIVVVNPKTRKILKMWLD